MSEYTKEQEAEALAHVETLLRPEPHHKHLRIVLAMAKRTAEAEAEAEREGMRERARHAEAQRDEAVSLAHESLEESVRAKRRTLEAETQRDALKARVAELEAQVPCAWVALDADTRDVLATGRSLESVKAQAEKTGRSYILDKHHPPAITRLPAPPVVVTREMVEALLNFVQFEAERDRARLLTELREVLGRTP